MGGMFEKHKSFLNLISFIANTMIIIIVVGLTIVKRTISSKLTGKIDNTMLELSLSLTDKTFRISRII